MGKGIVWIGSCMALVSVLGCGSSSTPAGGGGGGTFTTSVSGSKPLSTLSTADKTQLCADLVRYLSSSDGQRSFCKLEGLLGAEVAAAFSTSTVTDAQVIASCTQSYNECLNPDGGTSGSSAGAMGMCDTSQAVPANCTATVADYSSCIPAALGATAPECSTLTVAGLNNYTGPTSSPACTALMTKCPGIFDDSSGADGGV